MCPRLTRVCDSRVSYLIAEIGRWTLIDGLALAFLDALKSKYFIDHLDLVSRMTFLYMQRLTS